MKKIALLMLFLFGAVVSTPVLAQGVTTCNGYTPKQNDNLWDLSGNMLHDPTLWRQVMNQNPQLQGRRGNVLDGPHPVVIINPNDCIHGLDKTGWVLPSEGDPSLVQVPQHSAAAVTPAANTAGQSPTKKVHDDKSLPWWFPWLLAALFFGCLIFAMLKLDPERKKFDEEREKHEHLEELHKDPVTSGPPQVPGGVTDETADARLREIGAAQAGTSALNVTITDRVHGRIWGDLLVSYADGTSFTRRHNGEAAYRANVTFPNGTTRVLYLLQGCGNEVRYGGVNNQTPGEGFRFVPDEVAPTVEAPVPATEPAPLPVAEPAPAAIPEAMETDVGDDNVTFKVELKAADADRPGLITLKGVDAATFSIMEKNDGTTHIRYRRTDQ